MQGVAAWNQWRLAWPYASPDLSGMNFYGMSFRRALMRETDFSGAILTRADLFACDLTMANLNRADLSEAVLGGANLTSARMRSAHVLHAKLYGTNLSRANLSGANFEGTHFQGVNLSHATLTGVNLDRALMQGTVFASVDLSTAMGLETVRHLGPSTIGIDTMYLSRGQIPEGFLRGAGIPEGFIVYMKSLAANPIEFHSCFISYSSKDQKFANRLSADLQNAGVRCWFAPHHAQSGRKLHEQIDVAISLHEKLLLILSPHSMNSEWVKTEIAKARKREINESKRLLFPIRVASFESLQAWECFDADTGKDSAREIREYFIPDFSNWKDSDSYRSALERLVRDLKTEKSDNKTG